MYKVLVIGCGNIGAQYDMNNHEIQTHVKAWYLNKLTNVYIYDLNIALAQQVSKQYGCEIVESININMLTDFSCVSICTPTSTHLDFLKMALAANVNTIICEKPVSNNYDELNDIKRAYENNSSKVLVNYMRRFLPAFAQLKQLITSIIATEKVTNVSIRYQRGFINNCSHAFDLIEYIIGAEIVLTNITSQNKVADHFNDDTTLSLQALWGDINVSVLGLSNICFSHFEIDIYFEYHKITIKNAGDIIEVYQCAKTEVNLQPLVIKPQYTKHNCLKNYMKFVTDYAIELIKGATEKDNFINSVLLNQKMLKYKDN